VSQVRQLVADQVSECIENWLSCAVDSHEFDCAAGLWILPRPERLRSWRILRSTRAWPPHL
jgi:hypothetical protein